MVPGFPFVQLVENDTAEVLSMNYEGVDVSAFQTLALVIDYKPLVLSIDGLVDSVDHTTFTFPWQARFNGTIAPAAVGATSVQFTPTDAGVSFADLPATGELMLLGTEHVRYTGKSGSSVLTLETPLVYPYLVTSVAERMPDLRAGSWMAQVETVDASGDRLTFTDLLLKIGKRYE